MKYKTILMGLILIATLFSDQSQFKIDGMVCKNGCVYKVNSTVTSIEGVIYADVNFETGILSVEYNPKRVNLFISIFIKVKISCFIFIN